MTLLFKSLGLFSVDLLLSLFHFTLAQGLHVLSLELAAWQVVGNTHEVSKGVLSEGEEDGELDHR